MFEKILNDIINNQIYLQAIVRNANRLEKLVDDLLDVTRIESRTMTLVKEMTNLEYLIDTVVQDFRVNIKNKKKVAIPANVNAHSTHVGEYFTTSNLVSCIGSNGDSSVGTIIR